MEQATIHYTYTDEAPALATWSLLPVFRSFLGSSGIRLERPDISLAGRLLAAFPERLTEAQRVDDALSALGALATTPEANIIKLPNISASLPQLKAAISELQGKGFDLPDYPDQADTPELQEIRARYDRVKGSAVNPVLREGNSDRRAPKAVKEFARAKPHSMGRWSPESRTHVASMERGDFFAHEQSVTLEQPTVARIEWVGPDGEVKVLKSALRLQAGEILDATFLSRAALVEFLAEQVEDARSRGVLFSVHLKATMMKVSDPILFGHVVRVFFRDFLVRHRDALASFNPNNGLGDLVSLLEGHPERAAIEADLQAALAAGPALAMVDSDRGITNLHFPNDVIIDASMPAMIRTSGQMWNAEGKPQDTKAVIPDRTYAGVYRAVLEDCKRHGAYDPRTMGSVPNVGLMAQKAEEYGSHDKTFEIDRAGEVRVVDAAGQVLTRHAVEPGDIWRACQTKDAPIRDWVSLALRRARATGAPAIFWLDEARAHDAQVLRKVREELAKQDTTGLEIAMLAPEAATQATLARLRAGQDTISVTGNVLRDYLTDLFPILELGTSAKMLSIVPLMNGGGLFETGAGGSAPKHVQQFEKEGYLRWDSLGEFLAMAVSLEMVAEKTGSERIRVLAETLDSATGRYLAEDKAPARRVGQIDNRGSHFYLALYWAHALAEQTRSPELAAEFRPLADALAANEAQIAGELLAAQGQPQLLGGYYQPEPALAEAAMRPSATLNALLDGR